MLELNGSGPKTEVEDRQWAQALLAGENRLLEMIARGDALSKVLDAVCRLVEEMSRGSLVTILLLDPSGTRLRHGAAPSLPASFTGGIDGHPVGPWTGPCGRAVYLREPVIVPDLGADPRWAKYCELAAAHGLRACWSAPILSSEGTVLGTFAILWREPRSPTPQQQILVGQITHLAAVAIERKRTEAALQESEERFRRMADTISEVIWITDLDPEKVLYTSPSFERIWGLPVEDLYRNPRLWTETIHPEDRDRVTKTFARWIAGDQVSYHDVEFRIIQPNGALRWIHERGVLTLKEDGKAYRASGISTDITERKQAEQDLRRSEAFQSEAQRLSRTGSFGWCVSTGDLVWSEETCRILGYDRETKPSLDLVLARVHPQDRPVVQQAIDRATRYGEDFDIEHRLLLPDGSMKHLQVVAHATTVGPGKLVEFVGAVMDVTDRKRSEDAMHKMRSELAHVARVTTLGELTASIAHEVNQPLAGIVMNGNACLRWLERDSPNLQEAIEATRRIVRDGTRAGDVITRLRDLFKKAGTARAPLDMNQAIREVIQLTRREMQRHGVVLRTVLTDGLPPVSGDRVQLQQVVLNLILNAAEAMSGVQGRPRELAIGTRLEGGEVQVAVTDSGVGLDPQTKDRIFDAFYTTKSDGMGMGLSISRSIIESHGGRLWAESNDGPGATFRYTIPRPAVL